MIQAASTTIVSFPELGLGPWSWDRFLVQDLFGIFSIAWYGLIICIGMILGCTVVLRNATKKEGFGFDSFLDYFIFCIPLAVVGARVMYVAAKWEEYDSFYDMIAIWKGGIAVYGAVIVGALTVLVVAKIKKHNPLKVFDAMVPGLLLGQAIGRWGNFVNGEAFGTSTDLPWGMTVGGVGPVHPTFLYESLLTFAGFLLATFVVYRFKKTSGQVFCFYLVWYGVGRALIESLRIDSLFIGSLRLAQCIGIFTALLGLVLFVILSLAKKHIPEPELAEGQSETAILVSEEKTEESEEKEEKNEESEEKEEKVEETDETKQENTADDLGEKAVETEKETEEGKTEDGTDH